MEAQIEEEPFKWGAEDMIATLKDQRDYAVEKASQWRSAAAAQRRAVRQLAERVVELERENATLQMDAINQQKEKSDAAE